MKIKYYTLKQQTRWELFQFMQHVLSFSSQQSEEMPQAFTDKLEELRTTFDIYDEELVQERKPTPHQLLQAEDGRLYAIRKLFQLIGYFTNYRYDAEKELAAKKLKLIFKRYGTGSKISRLNQDTKTAVITNLLQDLSKDVPIQYIATFGLTDVMEALHINNQVFSKEQLNRRSLEAEYVTGVVKTARLELQNQFMEFVALINALAMVDGPEKYIELKQIIMTLVHDSVAKVKQRTKKKVVQL